MKLSFSIAAAAILASLCAVNLGCGGDNNSGNGGSGVTGGSGGSGTGGNGVGGSGASGVGGNTPGGLFEAPEPWTKDVSKADPDAKSDDIINALDLLGGWGAGALKIDFSISLLHAGSATPRKTVTGDPNDYCYGGPDCDSVPLQMPAPADGNAEGQPDYNCPTADEDCHILVVEKDEKKLYELYNATADGDGLFALGAFIWDLTKSYPDTERGEQCTSADAAGFPIAGLLPTADEVAAGEIHHAIRFILPNPRMKTGVYVHPASHAGAPSSEDPNAPPYGVRFRLKADFDETPFNDGEKVVLHALKTYGMLLSDGGNIAFTFADDRYSTAKWSDVGVAADSFTAIAVSDFEVVDLGPEVTLTYDCVRNP